MPVAARLSGPTSHRHADASERTPTGKRLDIQGLRMVAVVAVVANHLTGKPVGGFVGVDVFFVISGYLITGRLLRMLGTANPAAYFGTFYQLRARRILPAAITVIGLTIVASHFVFDRGRAHNVTVDGLWAMIFWANWHFAANGTNYFQANGPISPFQHYWSLAVEEQFYLAWPVILLLVGYVVGLFERDHLRARNTRLVAGAIAAVGLCALSWWWGVGQTSAHPTSAYFSSLTRAWELGVGALLACATPLLRRSPAALATTFSWAGLVSILVSLFVVRDSAGFPVPWAALPVAGSALVIIGSAVGEARNIILTNRVSVFLGDISYSIYLTHFPFVVILGALMPHWQHLYWAAVILGTLGLSIASYYFIEEPFRSFSTGIHKNLDRAGVAALAFCVGALGIYVCQPAKPIAYVDAAPVKTQQVSSDPSVAAPSKKLAAALDDAVQLTSFPALTNASTVDDDNAMFNDWSPCEGNGTIRQSCVFSPASGTNPHKVALVVGDSIALSYLPAIRGALVPQGWTVVGIALEDCGAADVQMTLNGSTTPWSACDRQHAFYAAAAEKTHPRLVIFSSATGTPARMYPPGSTIDDYERGMAKTLSTFSSPGRKLLVMSPPPRPGNLQSCDVAGNTPQDCFGHPTSADDALGSADSAAAEAEGAAYLNTADLFCTQDLCPAVVGATAVTYDGIHMTPSYAAMIAPSLRASLKRLHLT